MGQLAHLSGRVQRSRNSVPYMMNFENHKAEKAELRVFNLFTVKPKYNNGFDEGITVLLNPVPRPFGKKALLYGSLFMTDACGISVNNKPSVLA